VIVLGISELDNDAGACALIDGKVAAAANEERFTRVKQHPGFPFMAVDWICKHLGLEPSDFDGIAIAKPAGPDEIRSVRDPVREYDWSSETRSTFAEKWLTRLALRYYRLPKHRQSVTELCAEIDTWLGRNGFTEEQLYRVDHHRAHALSAYFASGFDSALVVTCDGQGGGVTGTVWEGRGRQIRLVRRVLLPHSMGNFYAAATKALGFRPNRHEGKVTGLAAYGENTAEDLEEVRRLAWVDGSSYLSPCVYGAYPRIKRFLARVGKERFSAAFQTVLEEVVTGWVERHLAGTDLDRVTLAGGTFANVKLNQRISEIEGVGEVFVFPGMADGGLGYGAAVAWDQDRGEGETTTGIDNVFWGPEPTDSECSAALAEARWVYTQPKDLEGEVAQLLEGGETVAVCRGRMEFGPRALGHRSILYQTTDPTVNDWLNRKLRRTEFMPFAPVTRAEDAKRCYPGLRCLSTARFMTITTRCSKEMEEKCPAVVHVDGTARPQLVEREVDPFCHGVLTKYLERTGVPSLVNTSFNLHEEPIVCTASDAIRAAKSAQLDRLVLGSYLAKVED
jgi:carbamoyltransferase